MKVWWCEEHRSPKGNTDTCQVFNLLRNLGYQSWNKRTACHMVEMQLVPADVRMVSGGAIVIEKENGQWPEWITDVDGPIWYQCGGTYGLLDDIAEAIAERAQAEPPPKDPCGWVWDPETVERIAVAIEDAPDYMGLIADSEGLARTVLAALNSLTPEEAK